jgi:hypothetical protein
MRRTKNHTRNQTKPTPRFHHSTESWQCRLYAIRLDPSVLQDPAFLAMNPGYVPGYPLCYVGMTSLTPEERFRQHSGGKINASRIAHQYGRELSMNLVPNRKPTRRTWVLKHERNLARELRAKGYGVWQA